MCVVYMRLFGCVCGWVGGVRALLCVCGKKGIDIVEGIYLDISGKK